MARGYGSWVGGDDWRAIVDASVTTNNPDKAVVTIKCLVESEYGTTSGYSNIRGAVAYGSLSWNWGSATSISTNSTKTLKTATYTINKTHSAQTIQAQARVEGIAGIYSGDYSRANVNVSIAAKTSYAVSYNANGGSGAPSSQTKWYGETLTLSSTKPTRANYTFKGWATSSGGGVAYASGATYTANAAVTLYAVWERSYTVPTAVSGLSLSRVSDSQLKATWTNNSAVPREYTKMQINIQTDSGSWVELSSLLGATSTSYTWNGAQANHRYRVAVRPYNPAGWGSWAYSDYVYTTPAPPTSVEAVKATASTVEVNVTSGAPWAESHVVEVTSDVGETWTSKGTVAGSGGTLTDTTPPAGTCQYRARAVIGSMYSAYTTSAEIVTLTAPFAPTITERPSAAIAVGSDVAIAWAPNHPDGTAQTQAQVEVTAGGSTTTVAISGATTTVDLSSYVETVQAVSVRVRTYGLYADWGEWSAPVAFGAFVPPSVSVTSPSSDGEVMTALPVVVAWSAVDVTGIASQVVRLFDDNGVLLRSWQVDPSESTLSLDRSTYFLTNGASYSVEVAVGAGSTLQGSASRSFVVDYLGPAEPTADIWWDEDRMSCAVTVGEGEDDTGTLPTPTSYYVVRVMPDGSEWLVEDGLDSSQQAIDPLPPLGVTYSYRVVAVAESGVETPTVVETIHEGGEWAFTFGHGAAVTVLLESNAKQAESIDHEGEVYHFADGTSNGLPMFYGAFEMDVSLSWSFRMLRGRDDVDAVRRAARQYQTCWARDPLGHRWYVYAKWQMTQNKRSPVVDVSCSAVELRFEEVGG